MVAFSYRMPAGIPGEVNRINSAKIEAQIVTPLGTTGAPSQYGLAMVVDNTGGNVGNMRVASSSDTAIYGFLVRPFPTGASQDQLGTSTPPASGIVDIMRSGYMLMKLGGVTAAAKGGQVYIYVTTTDANNPVVGGIAAATSASAIAVPNCIFMGPADTSNFVEIAFNI